MLCVCLLLRQVGTFYDQPSADNKHFLPNALFLCYEGEEQILKRRLFIVWGCCSTSGPMLTTFN
jgi:hypothetical protein